MADNQWTKKHDKLKPNPADLLYWKNHLETLKPDDLEMVKEFFDNIDPKNAFANIYADDLFCVKTAVDICLGKDFSLPDIDESAPPKQGEYFQKNGNHWEIKFQNEFAAHLDHVDGLAYIAHILSTKGGGISDIQLYSIAKGGAPEADSNEKTAIENGLYIQAKYQESHDTQAHRKILAKFNQLKIDLENAESILEKKEIEDDMKDLLSHMKQRNIGGQEEKAAQANISKRLKIAYSALERGGMKDLADHLRKNIKTANYGREYTGAIAWEIIL